MSKEWTKEDSAKMDRAAAEAAKELQVTWSGRELMEWVAKWTPTAGYKRLMRIAKQAYGLK